MSSHKLRVLVVDDERLIADSLSQIFASQGFESRAVYEARSALLAVDSFAPDVLISDIVMPGMDGWELAAQYGRMLPSCRVILFSGHAHSVEMEQHAGSFNPGMEVYTKPVSPTVFLERLRMESQLLA